MSEINDILKILSLAQSDIDALSDKDGFYYNSTKGEVEYDGKRMSIKGTQGFIDYNDTSGDIDLQKNVWTDVPNNGLGAFSNDTYAPNGVTDLIDTTTGYFDVTQLDLGDAIFIRNDFQIIPTSNDALVELRYSLGTGAGTYFLEKTIGTLGKGSGIVYRPASLEVDYIYMGDTNTRDNPIKLQVKLSSTGTLINAGSVIQVIKR